MKSLLGEELDGIELLAEGVAGDRRRALRTAGGRIGAGKRSPRYVRLPRTLAMSARTSPGGVLVTLPDGTELPIDDPALPGLLGEVVGQPVTPTPEGRYLDAEAVHLVTTASVRWWAGQVAGEDADWRRLRPNVLVDAEGAERVEDAWVGRRVRVGACSLKIVDSTERCLMLSEDQLGLGRAPGLLRSLARRGLMLGVYARVVVPGEVRVGDPVTLE